LLNLECTRIHRGKQHRTGHVEHRSYALTAMRYAGIRVIPYFSHSFACEPGIKQGQTVIDMARRNRPANSEQLLQLLAQECLKAREHAGKGAVEAVKRTRIKLFLTVTRGG